jgi:hypothetical protein
MRKRQITNEWLQFIILISFLLLSILAFCSMAYESDNADVEEAFETDDDEDSIQRYSY